MGGRIHGFLGGVFVSSLVTYYTSDYLKKNQNFISTHLRASNDVVHRILSPDAAANTQSIVDKRLEYQTRNFTETCKDIWNDEVIRATNWIYGVDWYNLGISTDRAISNLFNRLVTSIGEKKD